MGENSVEYFLVGLQKEGWESAGANGINFAKFMADRDYPLEENVVTTKVNKDFRLNKTLLDARIGEAKRDAAKYAQ